MNKVIQRIIDEIDQKLKCSQISFEDDSWRESIPAKAGWYLIKTNTPIAVLKSVGRPKYKSHINIPETINNISMLQDSGIAIIQSDHEDYVVYNGEAKNLKARAREHERGHPKTYCLGLSNYETLRSYKWTFCYVVVSTVKFFQIGDKLLRVARVAVEQGLRAKNGWPILCRK